MSPFPTSAFLASLPFVALGLAALILATWFAGRRLRRFAIIDVVWGLGFVVAAAIAFFASAGHGDDGRRLLLLALTTLWGLRLAGYLAWRQRGSAEDPRYVDLLERAPEGKGELHMLTKVYTFQLVVMFLVAMVQVVGMFATGPLTWVAWVGVAVWAVGMFFETVGNAQLAAFKADPANRGRIMDRGVWAWTRHPNYFGDTAVWWGLFLGHRELLAGRPHRPLTAPDDVGPRLPHGPSAHRAAHGRATRLGRVRGQHQQLPPRPPRRNAR